MPNEFKIPKGYLTQLNEFTSGGYLILTFDERGNPRMTCKFDSSAYSLAAQKYIQQWTEAAHDAQKEMLMDAMYDSQIPEDEEEHPDDDEE